MLSTDEGSGRVGVVVYPWEVAVARNATADDSVLNHLDGPITSIIPLGNRVRIRVGPRGRRDHRGVGRAARARARRPSVRRLQGGGDEGRPASGRSQKHEGGRPGLAWLGSVAGWIVQQGRSPSVSGRFSPSSSSIPDTALPSPRSSRRTEPSDASGRYPGRSSTGRSTCCGPRGSSRSEATSLATVGRVRTILGPTPSGRRLLARWLAEPVEHVREVRSLFLLKLLFLERQGSDPQPLIEAQLNVLGPVAEALEERRAFRKGLRPDACPVEGGIRRRCSSLPRGREN